MALPAREAGEPGISQEAWFMLAIQTDVYDELPLKPFKFALPV